MGVFCENRCPFPYYGDQCIQKCNCRREECDHVTGCPPPGNINLCIQKSIHTVFFFTYDEIKNIK